MKCGNRTDLKRDYCNDCLAVARGKMISLGLRLRKPIYQEDGIMHSTLGYKVK